MRLEKGDRGALVATLAALAFPDDVGELVCLAFSKAVVAGNRAVHLKANEQLLEILVKGDPGPCYHVTGEMRALADPFHRRLCAELVKRAGSRFTLIYNIPREFSGTPEGVGLWNARSWESHDWTEKLSAINLIGDEFVDIRAYDTQNEIQYSVFGNRYVLLQEKHADNPGENTPTPKRVWLLRSARLNEHLTARAMGLAARADDIPEVLFRRFSARVNGITSRIILNKLSQNGGRAPIGTILNADLEAFDPEAGRKLDSLRTIGFISSGSDEMLELTAQGQQYLGAIESRVG